MKTLPSVPGPTDRETLTGLCYTAIGAFAALMGTFEFAASESDDWRYAYSIALVLGLRLYFHGGALMAGRVSRLR